MSFDEQPGGDIHGERAAEIHRLVGELRTQSEHFERAWQVRGDGIDHLQSQLGACRPYLKEGETVADAMARLEHSESFYRRRCEALQAWQSSMRNPERVIVCDILANGFTLDQPLSGDRYAGLMPAAPTTTED